MKLTIERADLLKSLSHVQNVVERRTTIPVLANVRLEGAEGQVRLNATDMDLEIAEVIPADIVRPGVTTAPAHTLYDIVRKLPDGAQIELDLRDDGVLVLRAGRSKFSLAVLPADSFPVLARDPLPTRFSLPVEDLQGLIDRTRFAVSNEETRYYLNGIYLHTTAGDSPMLRAAATDGHRLARVEVPAPTGTKNMPGVIIPRKAVNEVRKLLDEAEQDVEISLSESKIAFHFGRATLTSKLVDGTFPEYERVIPQGNNRIMTVDAKTLAQAVDRVSAISIEKSRAVKMRAENGGLTLSASSAENGSATEELEANYSGPVIEIGFNCRYLLDVLERITGKDVLFAMADSASPTIVSEVGNDSAIFVLMPMRV